MEPQDFETRERAAFDMTAGRKGAKSGVKGSSGSSAAWESSPSGNRDASASDAWDDGGDSAWDEKDGAVRGWASGTSQGDALAHDAGGSGKGERHGSQGMKTGGVSRKEDKDRELVAV